MWLPNTLCESGKTLKGDSHGHGHSQGHGIAACHGAGATVFPNVRLQAFLVTGTEEVSTEIAAKDQRGPTFRCQPRNTWFKIQR
jgi:hypothetical protein